MPCILYRCLQMQISRYIYTLVPGGGEGLAGERDGVGAGRGGAALHDAAVRLQRAHHGRAQRRVGGEDVQLVRLLDVDGKVGDGLTALLQHRLGLLVAHGGQVQQYLQYSVKMPDYYHGQFDQQRSLNPPINDDLVDMIPNVRCRDYI